MVAVVQVIEVGSADEMERTISAFVIQGYALANKTPDSASMIKRKEFSTLWAVIGFVVCVLPLLIYLIVYATQNDQVVEIRVRDNSITMTDALTEIGRLKALHERGAISDDEFEIEKGRLLHE